MVVRTALDTATGVLLRFLCPVRAGNCLSICSTTLMIVVRRACSSAYVSMWTKRDECPRNARSMVYALHDDQGLSSQCKGSSTENAGGPSCVMRGSVVGLRVGHGSVLLSVEVVVRRRGDGPDGGGLLSWG